MPSSGSETTIEATEAIDDTAHALMAPKLISRRYQLGRRLGAGGMGEVYEAHDTEENRSVALKRLLPSEARREENRLRLEREYHTLAGFEHPSIVEVYSFGSDEGEVYYTMELLSGPDIRASMPYDCTELCRLLRGIASGLAFLHTKRLIHRDLKPDNIRLNDLGIPKIIDFGGLVSSGCSVKLLGTPPFMAPECVQQGPLDHRVDLYALGAMAYYLLTGQHAYPARGVHDLPLLHQGCPTPPSELIVGIPSQLDELVLDLMSLDRLGRPNAALVIARLTAIGKLEPAPNLQVAQSYLRSASIVGRDSEIQTLDTFVARAAQGKGGSMLIQAASGMGKTRLLREAAVLAQIAEIDVIQVDCTSGSGRYAVVKELMKQLLRLSTEQTRKMLSKVLPSLLNVLPELRESFPEVRHAPVAIDPMVQRVNEQQAFGEWIAALCDTQPLLLLIDNAQRCDEASAGALLRAQRMSVEGRLLLLYAQRTDERVQCAAALDVVAQEAHLMPLAGLDHDGLRAFVDDQFGEIPQVDAIACWLLKEAGGSPMLSSELLRFLVDEEILEHRDGQWLMHGNIDAVRPPEALQKALDGIVEHLPQGARTLAQALSVLETHFSLGTCLDLADATMDELAAPFDQLVQQDVLTSYGYAYGFRHDGLREAVLRSISKAALPELHLRAAQTLTPPDAPAEELPEALQSAIGWHLVLGGKEMQGAQLLEQVGRRFSEQQLAASTVQTLAPVIEIYERNHVDEVTLFDLRTQLLVAAAIASRERAAAINTGLYDQARHYAGVPIAMALRPWIGRPLALMTGLGLMALRRLLRFGSPTPKPSVAMSAFIQCSFVLAAADSLYHRPPSRSYQEELALIAFAKKRCGYAVYLFAWAIARWSSDLGQELIDRIEEAIAVLEADKGSLPEVTQRIGVASGLSMITFYLLRDQHPRCMQYIDRIAILQLPSYRLNTALALAVYRSARGEEALAQAQFREVLQIQGEIGRAWNNETIGSWMLSLSYAWPRDVQALRGCIDTLNAKIVDGFQLENYRDLALGEYQREFGKLTQAQQTLEQGMQDLDTSALSLPFHAALGETYLALGQHAEAEQLLTRALKKGERPQEILHSYLIRIRRALALVQAARGNLDLARESLNRCLQDAEPYQSPTISGSIHEAYCHVAALEGDGDAFAAHLELLEGWYLQTQNPVLIARLERVRRIAVLRPMRPGMEPALALGEEDTIQAGTTGHQIDTGTLITAVTQALPSEPEMVAPTNHSQRTER